jgi:hypothetical protein
LPTSYTGIAFWRWFASSTMIKRFLLCEQAAIKFAFPLGSMLHGACVEHCAYLWIARPPKIKAWHRSYRIAGFIKLDSLPTYFHNHLPICATWNEPAPPIPWETEEETRLRLEEEDQFSQSDLGSQALACAVPPPSKKRPPPLEAISISSSMADSGDLFASLIPGRPEKRTRFDPALLPFGNESVPAAIPPMDLLPPTHASLSQYAPAQSCVGHGNAPFGRAEEAPPNLGAFNPFPANTSGLAP